MRPSLRKQNYAPIFLVTLTVSFLIHHCLAETLNLSNGDKVRTISHDQEEIINAVKNEVTARPVLYLDVYTPLTSESSQNYEKVASLAAGAKQRKEYEQVRSI